ncbi:MAG: membrane protein insertase YidC [Verrucomicrobiales bacterium]|nr:membrane protein insertase YidC [Verrucomicrobiota bacterium JB025]
MYDRKTWIVLIVCGALLAVNLYFSSQNQKAAAAERAAKEAIEKTQEEAPRESTAELTVETPPPPTEKETVVLQNDLVSYTLTNIGGGIEYVEFAKQLDVGSETSHVRVNRNGAGPIGTIAGAGELLENVAYAYKADESEEGRKAVYIAKLQSGLVVKKTYSLKQGNEPGARYLIDLKVEFENASANALNLNQWSVYLGEASPLHKKEISQQVGFFRREGGSLHFTHSGKFKGGMFGSPQSVINSPTDESVEFVGVTSQFFATVLRPKDPMNTSMWAKSAQVTVPLGPETVTSVSAGLRLPPVTLAPTERKEFDYLVFVGPKHNNMLRKMNKHWGTGWGDVMQYGLFWFVSRPLNWLLNTYHNLLDTIGKSWSWGLAIILLTITVRIFIWPLHAKSTHTMKRMSKLQPKMAELKEKYADDPTKLNTEMMGLYKKYGINPLGGCLPMFIQLPVFFGFYRMLQYAVELRGQGFLWVNDLSQPDTLGYVAGIPLNLLPTVMAITSFAQIAMTPKTGDKMQQRIIMFMPLMFFFFCYNFASALALYWTTQNLFSIGQTWLMNKVPEPELKAVKPSKRKSWVERMAEKQAELQKQRGGQPASPGAMRDATPKKKRPPRTGG